MSERRPRTICVVLVDRANYGRLKPVMQAIKDQPDLELQVLATGTMVLERFGQPVNVVRQDGFEVVSEIYIELEGSTPTTMAKSVGFGVVEFASEFHRLKPDIVLVIGDRYEALAAAIAAAYMNLTLVHLQGGEVSGSIDESARHAITKLSHFHFPATRRSADYLIRMGERADTILGVGCPSSDIARKVPRELDSAELNRFVTGRPIDLDKPFLLVIFHPNTTEYGDENQQMAILLGALDRIRMPTLILWPNIDAGSNHINKAIRIFRVKADEQWFSTATNLVPEIYLQVLARAACAVGNSSSFVRDASYSGTPVVLVGSRQDGRETDKHVTRVPVVVDDITAAIKRQLAHGRYAPSKLYGDGYVADRIAEALQKLTPYRQKKLAFTLDSHESG